MSKRNITDLSVDELINCEPCESRGDIKKCLTVECFHHENWYAKQQQERIDELQDTLTLISEWCEAYPLEVFPEPDFTKAGKVLEDNGITLDAITASNMRRVLTAIQAMIEIDNQR